MSANESDLYAVGIGNDASWPGLWLSGWITKLGTTRSIASTSGYRVDIVESTLYDAQLHLTSPFGPVADNWLPRAHSTFGRVSSLEQGETQKTFPVVQP